MDLSSSAQSWVNLLFLWVGFGAVVGLVARTILPEGEPKGLFGVLVIGVSGSCAGPLIVSQLWKPAVFNPISPLGFFASILVSLALLLIYRSALSVFKHLST